MTEFKPLTLSEVEDRIKQCEEVIQKGQRAYEEKKKLETYRDLVFEIQGSQRKAKAVVEEISAKISAQSVGAAKQLVTVGSTAEVAKDVLSASGKPVKIRDMVQMMRARGWESTGDDKKDFDRVYASVRRKPAVFENAGGGSWKLKSENSVQP